MSEIHKKPALCSLLAAKEEPAAKEDRVDTKF